jgi:predicted alpha/beta hydrolase family esterase
MAKIFIIHGAYGNPEENWFPWLKGKLESEGHTVFVPRFPTPEGQSLENWMKEFKQYASLMDEDSIVLGHSIGAAFILSALERSIFKPIKASFLVSGFICLLGDSNFDRINKTFVDKKFDWKRIRQNCGKFCVLHSDNDPYIPLEKAKDLAGHLGVNVTLVKNAGHFNKKAGYTKFDILLNQINDVIGAKE